MPGPPLKVPPALPAIHAKVARKLGPHICTGPVAVKGAKPGQVLQVEIEAIDVAYDWGYNAVRPLAGALPDDFETRVIITLDRARRRGGCRGARRCRWRRSSVAWPAPPPAWGMLSTAPPRRNGGNLDNKELGAGATLYLPIFVDDALFSVGDGHGVQGDGEVCITAVETGLTGFPPDGARRHAAGMADGRDAHPRDHDGVRSRSRRLRGDRAAPDARSDLRRAGLDRYQAYTLCSLAADLRVTQVVNGNKGIHVMLDKRYLTRAR